MKPRIGIGFLGEVLPVEQKVRYAALAEKNGLGSAWVAEHYYYRDAVVTAASILAVTKRILVGTAVVNPFTRHPSLLAMTAATLGEMAPGRFVLGIGTGVPTWIEDQMGIAMGNPGSSLLEATSLIKQLVAGKKIATPGDRFASGGVELGFAGRGTDVPVYLAAVGPRMLREATRAADGVILSAGTSASYLRNAVRTISEARGSGEGGPRVVSIVLLSVSRNGASARRDVKPWLLSTLMRPHREELVLGDRKELVIQAKKAKQLYVKGAREAALTALSDEVVERLSVSGTVEECLVQIGGFVVEGVGDLVLMPIRYGAACDELFKKLGHAGLT